ncbi:unnamed protein product, partial [Sphacelaria rigidula]
VEWQLVDANRPIKDIQNEIKRVAEEIVSQVKGQKIAPLWPRKN